MGRLIAVERRMSGSDKYREITDHSDVGRSTPGTKVIARMMLIPTYVAPSRIEGVGIFAAEDIRAGTLIWKLDPRLDRLLSKEEIEALPEVHQAFVERYGYPYPYDSSITIVELDNGRFMNHSTAPNTRFSDPDAGFARVTIAAHEELTCDYAEFDPNFQILPGRQFVSANEAAQA